MLASSTPVGDDVQRARMAALPRLTQFMNDVGAILAGGGSFMEGCEAPFAALVRDPAFVPDVVAYEMAALRRSPGYDVPRATDQLLPLAHTAHCRLGLRLVEPAAPGAAPPRTLHGLLRSAFIGVFGPGGASIERFVEEPPGQRLRRAGVADLGPGDTCACVGGRDLVNVRPGKTASVWLTFVDGREAETCWIYDYATLGAVRKQAASLGTPHLESAAKLVCELGYAPASDALASLCEHPAHYVRWTALRQLARLDSTRALALLERAKGDPHPHVRNAATATLARFHGAG